MFAAFASAETVQPTSQPASSPTSQPAPTSLPTTQPVATTHPVELSRSPLRTLLDAALPPSSSASGTPSQTESSRETPFIKGGIDDRPYLFRAASAIAIGGYLDIVGNYFREQGLSDGFSFEARRFNLFVTSTMTRFLRVTSEIEFEHGAREIALETAMLDLMLHHALNLRGGILLVPLGRFNLTHDAPLYDIIDRPLVSTSIIPATLSEIGVGLWGTLYPRASHRFTYEVYVVNGLGEGLIAADGTRIPEGKQENTFELDENGVPSLTGRFAYQWPFGLTIGASFYTGIFNTFRRDGTSIDRVRWMVITALDGEYQRGPFHVRGETAWAHLDLPHGATDAHAADQFGVYLEGSWRFVQGRIWMMPNASLSFVTRVDYIDLAIGHTFSNGDPVGDETARLTFGISFRPIPATSIRINYQHNWLTDLFNNASRRGGIQFGLATYF